jgi:hypothetical protein
VNAAIRHVKESFKSNLLSMILFAIDPEVGRNTPGLGGWKFGGGFYGGSAEQGLSSVWNAACQPTPKQADLHLE